MEETIPTRVAQSLTVRQRLTQKGRTRSWLIRLATFTLFASLWEIAAGRAGNPALATFTGAMRGFFDLALGSGDLWRPLMISNQALIIGYLCAVLVAIPAGLAIGRFKVWDRMADPYVAILLAMPVSPLIPVLVIALGLGLASRTVVVFLFAFVFMVVNTRAGVRQVDPSLSEMATSFGAKETEVWRLVIIPGASPAIFAGLRIGLGRGIAGMVIVELLLVASGIGRLLLATSGRLQGDLLFGVVVAIMLESLLLLHVVRLIERNRTSWVQTSAT